MRTLNSLTFDTTGLELQGDEGNVRLWLSPEDDLVSLHYFPMRPDIDVQLQDVDRLRARYRSSASHAGGAIIEVELGKADDREIVHVLIKMPQEPTGMAYVGSITAPFRDFSYVVKVQCQETGITGLRDTAVFTKLMQRGEVDFDEKTGAFINWAADPYDPSFAGPLARNRSEDAAYDGQFPEHPLSRARRVLSRIAGSLRFSEELKAEPRFG